MKLMKKPYQSSSMTSPYFYTGPGRYQNRVEKVISDLTPQQVFKLGQELGLYRSTLKKMPQEDIHRDMVQAWLTKMDDVPDVGGDPTWRSFARGLAELRLWGPVDIIRESEWEN